MKGKTIKELKEELFAFRLFTVILMVVLTLACVFCVTRFLTIDALDTQLAECEDDSLERVEQTESSISYWNKVNGVYKNFVCVGNFYIDGEKLEVPTVFNLSWNATEYFESRFGKIQIINLTKENCEIIGESCGTVSPNYRSECCQRKFGGLYYWNNNNCEVIE